MKKHFKKGLCALLSATLFFSVTLVGNAADVPASALTVTGENWMSAVADDTPLHEINLPGTHDSAMAHYQNSTGNYVRVFGIPVANAGAYACTQSLTISEQLQAGVRFFDLRFSPKSGELRLCHGDLDDVKQVNDILKVVNYLYPTLFIADALGVPFVALDTEFYAFEDEACTTPSTFETLMEHVRSFLTAHPSETLVLKMKRENGDAEAYFNLLKAQIEALKTQINPATGKPFLYREPGSDITTKMPTLAQARGQFILMCPEYEALGCGGNLEMSNGTGAAEYMGTEFRFHNHWDIPAEQKLEEVKQFVQSNAYARTHAPDVSYGTVLHTSSNVVMKQTPAQIDAVVSKWLFADDVLQHGWFYGWFLCDFLSRDNARTIWQTNF